MHQCATNVHCILRFEGRILLSCSLCGRRKRCNKPLDSTCAMSPASGANKCPDLISLLLVQDPSVTTFRSMRNHEVQPEEGEHYKDSALRRAVHGRRIEMFPDNLMAHRDDKIKEPT